MNTYLTLCIKLKSWKNGSRFFLISKTDRKWIAGIYNEFFFLFCAIFLKFYWSIIDLQCCVSGVQQSDSVIHIFILFQSFLLQVITEYWVEFPVLYSRSLLVTYLIYSSVCMLIPNSWFIPPPPLHVSPLVIISLFLVSVSLFLFCK